MSIPNYLIWLFLKLHENNTAKKQVNKIYSTTFKLKAGLYEGCVTYLIFFYIYTEHIVCEVFKDWHGKETIRGSKINNLQYVDDNVVLIALTKN